MNVLGIADLHFSHSGRYRMDIWGEQWKNHRERILTNWKRFVKPQDIVLIPGDITWEHTPEEAYPDLKLISDLPGRYKVFCRGNHDRWWTDKPPAGLPSNLIFLDNEIWSCQSLKVVGAMSWISPDDPCSDPLDKSKFESSLKKLEGVLRKLDDPENTILMLHFPPFNTDGKPNKVFDAVVRAGVGICIFGHFHMQKEWDALPKDPGTKTEFHLLAADYLKFIPKMIIPKRL